MVEEVVHGGGSDLWGILQFVGKVEVHGGGSSFWGR